MRGCRRPILLVLRPACLLLSRNTPPAALTLPFASSALSQFPKLAPVQLNVSHFPIHGSWACVYNTTPTIRRRTNADMDAEIHRGQTLARMRLVPPSISQMAPALPATRLMPLLAALQHLGLASDTPATDSHRRVRIHGMLPTLCQPLRQSGQAEIPACGFFTQYVLYNLTKKLIIPCNLRQRFNGSSPARREAHHRPPIDPWPRWCT